MTEPIQPVPPTAAAPPVEASFGTPPPGWPPAPVAAAGTAPARPAAGLAIAALILGIIGVLFGLVPLTFWIAGPLGTVGLVLGLVAFGRSRRAHAPKAMAAWGSGLSVGALVLSVVGAVIFFTAVDELGDDLDEASRSLAGASATEDTTTGTALDPDYSPPPSAPPAPEVTEDAQPSTQAPTTQAKPKPPAAPAAPALTVSQSQAVGEAESYLEFSGFSRLGLIQQLSSDYGSGFSKADATFAVDHLKVDWNEQAVRSAKEYLNTQNFSRRGLIRQLSSAYGSQFTVAQATYAADKVGL